MAGDMTEQDMSGMLSLFAVLAWLDVAWDAFTLTYMCCTAYCFTHLHLSCLTYVPQHEVSCHNQQHVPCICTSVLE
jgi:hypothetical protein